MTHKSERDHDIITLISTLIDNELLNVRTCLPGIITAVNNVTVDVELVIRRVMDNGDTVGISALQGIPVCFFGNADYQITFPITVGDHGLVLFADRDIQSYLETGKQSAPTMLRNHDLSDGLFIPLNLTRGLRKDTIITDALTLKSGTTTLIMNLDGTINVTGNMDINGDLNIDGEVTATGDVIAGTISLKTHTHPTTTEGSPTGQPIP